MGSLAEFFKRRHTEGREKDQEDRGKKKDKLRESWDKINSVVDSTGSVQASFKKIDRTCLPSDLRTWRYYDWLGGQVMDVSIQRKNDFIQIELKGGLNSFTLLLRERGNVEPTVLRTQGSDTPKPFLPDDPHEFAVNFTRVVRLHWDLAPRLSPQ